MSNSSKPELSIRDAERILTASGGELVLLHGKTGSGKSMWLKRIAGLEPMPDGVQIERKNIAARSIRMIFEQFPQLWLGQHIHEELCLGLAHRPSQQQQYQALANWHASELNLEAESTSLDRLQSIRLNMAAVELAASDLLLIDSYTDALNQTDAGQIATAIRDWANRTNTIVVVASNRWQDWLPLASRTWTAQSTQQLPTPEEPA